MSNNIDRKTVESFGDEWLRFDQSGMPEYEAHKRFNEYFAVFPGLLFHLMLRGLIWVVVAAAGRALLLLASYTASILPMRLK